MAISAGVCPGCGAPIEFKAGTSMSVVCAHCKHVVMRTDRELVNLGKVADVVFNDTALAHNDHGRFQGRSFVVEGRIVMQHPAGGTWEEYYALFDGRYAGWIEEAMGAWYVMQEVALPAPPFESCEPGSDVSLGSYGSFVVGERSEGTFLSAEGELPFAVAPGAVRRFVDLSAADGARASIHYAEGDVTSQVFVGVQTTFEGLGVYQRSGERAAHDVRTQEITCPSCGAPFPPRAGKDAQRIACAYCNALSDLATHRVLDQQSAERAKPAIPLGSKGMLDAVEWVVIGFVVRRTFVEGEEFRWEEYLLYNESEGYRWLIADEGSWLLGAPIHAGDVDTSRFPAAVEHEGKLYKVRNHGTAEVVFVLGEFYWRVEVGEKVLSHDFESRGTVLSREAADTEINWTLSKPVPASLIATSFGVDHAQLSAALPLDQGPSGGGFDSYVSGSSYGSSAMPRWLPIGAVVFFVFILMVGKCATGDDGSGSVRGGWSGGFGGK